MLRTVPQFCNIPEKKIIVKMIMVFADVLIVFERFRQIV